MILLEGLHFWIWCLSLVKNFVVKARIIPISNSRSCFMRANSTLLFAVDARIVGVDIIRILTVFTTIHFNILSEITNILSMHILVVCYLRLAKMRVAIYLILQLVIGQAHLVRNFRSVDWSK